MRTDTIEIQGKTYLLCLPLQGIDNLEKRYGGMENLGKAMKNDDICDTIIILAEMINCGSKYAKMKKIENPEPLSEEELAYGVDFSDFALLIAKKREAYAKSSGREVETIPNPEATAPVSK